MIPKLKKRYIALFFLLFSGEIVHSQCFAPGVWQDNDLPCGSTSGIVSISAYAYNPSGTTYYRFYSSKGQFLQELPAGSSYTFYVSSTDRTIHVSAYYANLYCESPKTEYEVTLNPSPGPPNITYAITHNGAVYVGLSGAAAGGQYQLRRYDGNQYDVFSNTTGAFSVYNHQPSHTYTAYIWKGSCPSSSVQISNILDMNIQVSGSNHLCAAGTASLTAQFTNYYRDMSQYKFKWYNASNQLVQDGSATYTPQVSSNTQFSVKAYHIASGCEGPQEYINVTVGTPTVSLPSPEICQYGNITFTATGSSGVNYYTWNKNSTQVQAGSSNKLTVNVNSSDIISVKAKDSFGCESSSASVKPTLLFPNPVNISQNEVCQAGNNVTISAFTYTGRADITYYFSYSSNSTPFHVNGDGNCTLPANSNQTIYVSAFDLKKNCETNRVPYTIQITPPPAAPSITYAITHNGAAYVGLNGASDGGQYQLQQLNGNFSVSNSTGAFYVNNYQPGNTYQAKIKKGTCWSSTVDVTNILDMNIQISGSNHLCTAGTASLTAQFTNYYRDMSQYKFKWYNASNQLVQDGSATYTPQVSANTQFSVKAYHIASGCEGPQEYINVTVGTPTVSLPSPEICQYGNITYTATGSSGVNYYTWNKNSTQVQAGSSNKLTVNVTGNDIISVKAKDSYGCESSSASAQPTLLYPNTINIWQDEVCQAGNNVTLHAKTFPDREKMYYFSYSSTGGHFDESQDGNCTLPTSSNQTIYVSVFDVQKSCETDRVPYTVQITPPPAAPGISYAIASNGTAVYVGLNGAAAGGQYRLQQLNGDFSESNSTGAFYVYNYQPGNTYQAKIKQGTCWSSTVDISNILDMNIQIIGAKYLCMPGTANLTAQFINYYRDISQYNFKWYDASNQLVQDGSATYTPQVNATTQFSVKAYHIATGCESSQEYITVTVGSLPMVSLPSPEICKYGNITFTATGSAGVNQYIWYNNGTQVQAGASNTLTVNLSGNATISVKGKDSYGCESSLASAQPILIDVNEQCSVNYILKQVVTVDKVTSAEQIKTLTAGEVQSFYTYYDGLGRPEQTVAVAASPTLNDIVTPFAYDNFGREAVKYLPYTDNVGDGFYKDNVLTAQSGFYTIPPTNVTGDIKPYSTTLFEPSPLNRVVGQYGAGDAWYDAQKKQTVAYRTNNANEVRLWIVDDSQSQVKSGSPQPYYAAGTLYVTETTDEDERKVTEFTDLQGRMVRQQQWISGSDYAITDYAYDDFGRRRYVLPPAIDKSANNTFNHVAVDFVKFIYAYKYDERGRVVEKHIPGAGWANIVYNKLDQPVFTQDASQAAMTPAKEWSFTKYDAHGRVVETGLYTSNDPRDSLKARAYRAAQWESLLPDGTYTNNAFPKSGQTTLAVNYYDNYTFTTTTNNGASIKVQGLPTGSKVKILDDANDWLTTVLFYDEKGRVICTASDQINGKWDKTVNTYDFTGNLLKSERNHNGDFTLTTANKYDHAGRLKTVKQHITGNDTVIVAQNDYNALGQLTKTTLHEGLDTIHYDYNIRGWLKAIKGQNFSEKLHYNEAVSGLSNTAQWSGNISAMEWQTPAVNTDWHAHWFTYDKLSQMETARYKRKGASDAAYSSSASTSKLDYYTIWMGYTPDKMGNIDWMTRVHNGDCWDDLVFTYYGNWLVRVREYSEGLPDMGFKDNLKSWDWYFNYNDAGRMYSDINMNHTITYNHLGLAKDVTQGAKKLEYTYDGTGRRLKKKFGAAERYYMDGIEHYGDTTIIHNDYGRLRRNNSSAAWERDYFLKDHLGNVRVVLDAGASSGASKSSPTNNTVTYLATMEESRSAEENQYFANVDATRADRPLNYPDANPLNTKLSKVAGHNEGLKLTLKVIAGDTVEISAKAFYNMDNRFPGKSVNIAPVIGAALAAMTNPVGTILNEASRVTNTTGAVASNSTRLAHLPEKNLQNNLVQPKSGINFVLYNNVFDVVDENTGYLPVDENINAIQNLATDQLVMKEAGFLEIFVNNDAQTSVYYDNLMVTTRSGNSSVSEVNAYYPFGMLMPGLSLMATPDKYNAYKHSAKELQKELELNWYDHGARMLATTTSRWFTPDPLAEKYYSTSPYVFCGNDPINRIDPNGMDWYFDEYGNYLDDDKNGSNIRYMSRETWESYTKGEDITKIADILQNTASLFSKANLSVDAQLNVYNHFNPTDLPLTAIDDGNAGMQFRAEKKMTTGEVSTSIGIRLEGNKSRGWADNIYEVTNLFSHEEKHYNDYKEWGHEGYNNTPQNRRESRAISTQMRHSSFDNTRAIEYQDVMRGLGIKSGMEFIKPLTPLSPTLKY